MRYEPSDILVSHIVLMTRFGISLHHVHHGHGLFDGWPCTCGRVVLSSPWTNKVSPWHRSFPVLGYFRFALMFSCTFLCAFGLLIRVLGHDVLKVTPQRFDGRELVAD